MFIFLLIYTYFIVWIWGSLSSICLQIPFPSLWLVFSLSLVVSFDTQKFFILNSNAIACKVLSFFSFFFCRFLKKSIYLFLERGEGRERERERNINVWLPFACPLLGAWPANQACALTGDQTSVPLVRRLALNPLSHTSQGWCFLL